MKRNGLGIGNTDAATSDGGGFQENGNGEEKDVGGASGGKFGWRWKAGFGLLFGVTMTARAMAVAATDGDGDTNIDNTSGKDLT